MRVALTILVLFFSIATRAQVGRVEQTMDTVPVGGDEQRQKMHAMEAHDRLQRELTQLRDSVEISISTMSQEMDDARRKPLTKLRALSDNLSSVISSFKSTEQDPMLYKKGTTTIEESRRQFKALSKASTGAVGAH